MKPINIYALTRVENLSLISRLERQMSARKRFLHVKQWEMKSLKAFTDHVTDCIDDAVSFHFYYSFQIPKLGKEFDLLRISDDMVINVELKSFPVGDDSIRKQLIQNRYYLSTLGKSIRSYTYISEENRLLRLTNGGRLIETDFYRLCEDLAAQKDCYEGDIEELFIEERYIISPLASPDRFLQGEYFLTSQQIDIKKHILKSINRFRSGSSEENSSICAQGFTGLPGTGKTLLLYDIAMELSKKQRVCVVHCGSYSEELKKLDDRLKRIDFYQCNTDDTTYDEADLEDYTAYLVDEAHSLKKDTLELIVKLATDKQAPVIFSYDCEDIIAKGEVDRSVLKAMEQLDGFKSYRLTNRIRTKSELSSYIQAIVSGSRNNHRKEYPSVSLAYACDESQASRLLKSFMADGYTYIYDKSTLLPGSNDDFTGSGGVIGIENVSFKEYDKVAMLINSRFNYADKNLRSDGKGCEEEGSSPVRNLFHGLNRAKSKIALIVVDNEPVFEVFLGIAQGWKV